VTEGGSAASFERRPSWPVLVIALLLIMAAAIVAWDATHMRSGVAAYARIGPRAFPYAIAAGLVLLGLCTAFEGFRGPPEPRERQDLMPMTWIIGGLIVQLALLRYAGFAIATGAVFAATARAFGRGPLWFTYAFGLVMSLAIWLFFSRGLQLTLPAGPLEAAASRAVAAVWASLAAFY
jgi:putative tricarboxylic transport membrane protein